jgi:hypothetical protein
MSKTRKVKRPTSILCQIGAFYNRGCQFGLDSDFKNEAYNKNVRRNRTAVTKPSNDLAEEGS